MEQINEFLEGTKPNYHHVVNKVATSDQVITFIVDTVNKEAHTPFVKLVVKELSYGKPSRDVFIKRVFDYVCHSVDYLRDPVGKEIIFTPKLLINRGKGDCKKQSTFIAAILKAAGIEPTLKVVTYRGEDWEHIYVTAKGEHGNTIILDPVNEKKYNKEVRHLKSREYYLDGTKSNIMPNELHSMGNKPDSMMGEYIGKPVHELNNLLNPFGQGMGKKKHHEDDSSGEDHPKHHKLKDIFKKILHAGAVANFAVPRASFLGLILLGKALEHSPLHIHLAKKLAEAYEHNADKVNEFWEKVGGNPSVLKKTITKGLKLTGGTHGMEGMGSNNFNSFDSLHEGSQDHTYPPGSMHGETIGQYTAAGVAAAITAATPIFIKVMTLLKKTGVVTPTQANKIYDTVEEAAGQHNPNGLPELDPQGNPIISNGSNMGDNGHSNGTPAYPSNPQSMQPGGGSGEKKGCFLTTACCEHFGLPDDCYELETLREFRDGFMSKKYPIEIALYKDIAPTIVEKIKADTDKEIILNSLFENIKLAVGSIQHGELDIARALYIDEIKKLISRYKIDIKNFQSILLT